MTDTVRRRRPPRVSSPHERERRRQLWAQSPAPPSPVTVEEATAGVRVSFFVPVAPVNPMNDPAIRGHWARRRTWAKTLQSATWAAVFDVVPSIWFREPDAPRRVVFELRPARPFDDDALAPACKPIRDALLGRPIGAERFLQLIHADDPASGHVFVYRQQLAGAGPRGFIVTIEPLGPPAPKR